MKMVLKSFHNWCSLGKAIDKPTEAQAMYWFSKKSKEVWPAWCPGGQIMWPRGLLLRLLWARRPGNVLSWGAASVHFSFVVWCCSLLGKESSLPMLLAHSWQELLRSPCLPAGLAMALAAEWGPRETHSGQTVVVSFKIKDPGLARCGGERL